MRASLRSLLARDELFHGVSGAEIGKMCVCDHCELHRTGREIGLGAGMLLGLRHPWILGGERELGRCLSPDSQVVCTFCFFA